MARNLFGGTIYDFAVNISGGLFVAPGVGTVKFYDAKVGGTQYTDLQTMGGTGISQVSTDANGFFDEFRGPDDEEIVVMWASFNDGPRRMVVTHTFPLATGGGGGGGGTGTSDDYYVAAGTDIGTLNSIASTLAASGGSQIVLGLGAHNWDSAFLLQDNIYVRGQGIEATVVNQTSDSSDTFFGTGKIRFGMSDFYLNGPSSGGTTGSGHGINLVKGARPDVPRWFVRDVIISDIGGVGVRCENGITFDLKAVTVQNNGSFGFEIYGQTSGAAGTSPHLDTCFANNNGNQGVNVYGYKIADMTYGVMTACATDNNAKGYLLSQVQGFVMNGCGAEVISGDIVTLEGTTKECHAQINAFWTYQSAANVFKLNGVSRATIINSMTNAPTGGNWINCAAGSAAIEIGSRRGGLTNTGTTANIDTTLATFAV